LRDSVHDCGNSLSHRFAVDGTDGIDATRGLFVLIFVSETGNKLGISVDRENGTVTHEDKLPQRLRPHDLVRHPLNLFVVEVLLMLVDQQWRPILRQ